MKANSDFLLGVSLVDPKAEPVVLEFQQEFLSEERIAVQAPRGLVEQLGPDEFAAHITDYYLSQYPAEIERVGRDFVLQAVKDAVEWGRQDARHLGGLL
jgi:hypothetical protein